jgi:hypothetical protein
MNNIIVKNYLEVCCKNGACLVNGMINNKPVYQYFKTEKDAEKYKQKELKKVLPDYDYFSSLFKR